MENLSPEILHKPFAEWQLDMVTVLIVCQLAGRAYTALRLGGGISGIWRSIMFGSTSAGPGPSNPPPPPVAVWIALGALLLSGCAINRQIATSTTTNPTNGVVTVTTARSSVLAFGDVKNAVAATKASAGKTLSVGATGISEETTSGAGATLGELIGTAIKSAK